MRKQKGYTLLEVMVTIIIVLILASVAIPMMRSRIDAAKWTEGKTMAGMIASAIRVWVQGWVAEDGSTGFWNQDTLGPNALGFQRNDMDGKHFNIDNFLWTVDYDGNKLRYTIRVSKGAGIWKPNEMRLSDTGVWEESVVIGM